MFSNFPIPQPVSKPIIASPFFMFLSDQQKATKAQNTDIKLLDLAANAIKEWDQVVSTQDEYTAKFLEESEKVQSEAIYIPQTSLPTQSEIKFAFDSQGNPMPPKRPLSGFFIFKSDCYDQVKRENPDLRITEITKLISERWRDIDPQTKAYYEKKHVEAKALYQQQVALFEATYGELQKKTRRRLPDGGNGFFPRSNPNPGPGENSDSD